MPPAMSTMFSYWFINALIAVIVAMALVDIASILIDKGAILLSPACASFDMFDDFEQRGRVFKDCVNNWGV
jgi:UDP-N-acetylmuramoylalanine--D-glutamate ligase